MKLEVFGRSGDLAALLEAATPYEGNLLLALDPPSVALPPVQDELAEFYLDLQQSRRQPGELPVFAQKGWTGNTAVPRALEFMRQHIRNIENRALVAKTCREETGHTNLPSFMKARFGFSAQVELEREEAEHVVSGRLQVRDAPDDAQVVEQVLQRICQRYPEVGLVYERWLKGGSRIAAITNERITLCADAELARQAVCSWLKLT